MCALRVCISCCWIISFPIYLYALKNSLCCYNLSLSNVGCFSSPFAHICLFCIFIDAYIHHSDLLEELNLAATQDLTWMKMTSLIWSNAVA